MKQEASKKSKLWIWLVAGIAVLLAAGAAVAGILLFGGNQPGNQGEETGPVGGRPAIYFNVDREKYLEADTGLSAREPGEDGNYYVRFAIDGELKELLIADKQLVNFIDTMDVMGLTLDADNTVIDAVDIREIATEVAKDFYVQAVNGDVLTLDSSLALNGMEMNVSKGELGRVFSLTAKAEFPGAEIELSDIQPMDSVTVYGNDLGEVTHIVVTSNPIESPIYWRCNQFYNSTTKETTRVPDENGVYSIDFFVNGERVTLKTKSKDEATAIDKPNKFTCHKGLVFDEDGYIIDRVTAASGIRGMLACEMYETISVDGNTFTAQRQIAGGNEVGKEYTATIDENCKIWDVSFLEEEENRGKATSLQVGDRLCVFTDTQGNPVEIFVTHRLCGSPLYVNFSKQASGGETTRKPDGDGWYYIDLVINNEIKTFRSKDKALISKIDTQNTRGVGLELDGDIITRVWGSEFVSGYGGAVGYTIDSITSIVLTMYSTTGTSRTQIMAGNCEVINISGVGGEMGSKTTPQVGDYCISINNPAGETRYLLVISRWLDLPIYYNLQRKYNSTEKTTTRTPVNGYYEFLMATGGKQVTVKTRDKSLATKIDSYSPGYMALKVSGGIVTEAYPSFAGTGGNSKGNGYYVKQWNDDGTLEVYSKSSGATQTLKMAKDVVVYNLSNAYSDHKGEKTTTSNVKKDDMIAGLTNRYGEVVILYIRSRAVDVAPCWHVKRQYSNGASTRIPDADGYYVFEIAQNGKVVTVKTKDKTVADDLDSRSALFGIHVTNGIVKGVYGPLEVKNAAAAGDINGTKFVRQSGNKLTVLKAGKEMTVTLRSDCKIFDIASVGKDFGKVTKLKEGDTIGRSYKDKDGNHSILFVSSRFFPRVKGQTGLCEHCNQVVTWEVWSGGAFPAQDGHYYVGNNMNPSAITMGHDTIDTDIVLDLNGKEVNFQGSNRGFLVYRGATLSIIDSVGGGKMATGGLTNNEGLIRIAAAGGRPGTLNLYGGTLTLNKQSDGSYTPLTRGGVVFVNGSGTTFNMYGGTITGGRVAIVEGKTTAGGNIYVTGGEVNIYGGKINDGQAENGKGHNIYAASGKLLIAGGELEGGITASGTATVTLSGTPKISKANGGLVLEAGAAVKLDQLVAGTVIPVDATGVFMTGLTNPEAVKGFFESTKEGFSIVASGDSLACGEAEYCDHCGQEVVWSEFEGTLGNGHFYMTADTRLTNSQVGAAGAEMTAVLDLRGFKLLPASDDQTKSIYRLMMLRGATDLTVFDSSEAQTGMLIGYPNTKDTGAVVRLAEQSTFTLLSGTIKLELMEGQEYQTYRGGAVLLNGASTTFNMLGGKITGGQVVSVADNSRMGGGNVYVRGGTFNMEGGVIEGGNSNGLPGVNMYISDEMVTNVNLMGGTIDGGVYVAPNGTNIPNVTIGGDIKIANKDNGLDLTSGTLINIAEMTDEAEIYVKADGVFTKPSEYFADAAEKILPIEEGKFVNKVTADKTLHYGEKYVDIAGATNENLVFEEGTNKAYCEHCGEVVEWTALEAITEEFALEADKHYYLTGNVENTAAYRAKAGYKDTSVEPSVEYWKTAVVHLNGFNVTSTDRAFHVNNFNELYILGNGTVSGASASTSTTLDVGAAATVYVRGKLNLMGGTYTTAANATLPTLVMAVPAGRTTIYSDVKFVKAEGATDEAIHVAGGRLELMGATIEGNVDMAQNIVNGNLTYQIHLVASDATVTGTLSLHKRIATAAYAKDIKGATKIGELNIAEGGLVNFVDLTDGADITVVATGIFTGANELNAEYVKAEYVKSGVTDMIVNVTDAGELEIAEPETPITNADLDFEEGTTKAFCEHCGEVVEWTALAAITAETNLESGKHYYLAESVENSAHYTLPGGTSAKPKTAVLHMNGKNITSSKLALFVKRNAELTILGTGTITGSNTEFSEGSSTFLDTLRAATVFNRGKIYAHGVTIQATDNTLPTITQANPGGITEINETAQVIGDFEAPAGTLIVKGLLDGNVDFVSNNVNGSTGYQAHMTVDNGTITGIVKVPMRTPNGGDATSYVYQLIGTVNIGSIEIESGKVLKVDQLAADSKVGIIAELDVPFTIASDNAQALAEAGTFESAYFDAGVEAKEGALVLSLLPTLKNLEFEEGTTNAYCAHCGQTVAWINVATVTNNALADGVHYYLAANTELTAPLTGPAGSSSARKSTVLHLNGCNLTNATDRVLNVRTYSDVTILGNGLVSGGSTAENADLGLGQAATIYVRGNLDLMGGTYTHAESTTLPTITMSRPNDALSIYDGVLFNYAVDTQVEAIVVAMGRLNVHGGIINGMVTVGDNRMTDLVDVGYHFYMDGGMITNVCYVKAMGKYSANGVFEVAGDAAIAGLLIDEGKLLTLGELNEDAMIFVVAKGAFTKANPKAAEYLDAQIIAFPEIMTGITVQDNVLYGTVNPEYADEIYPQN